MISKTLVFALLLIGVSRSVVLAQGATIQPQDVPPSAHLATVYFYESTPATWLHVKYWVYANGKPICKLNRNSHCQVLLPAGKNTFSTKIAFPSFGSKPSLSLDLEAGKTYYIQGDEKSVFWPPHGALVLTEVAPNPGKVLEIKQSKVDMPLATAYSSK